jgi:hypothetical protein
MALIPCPQCGHQISDKAMACPHCKYTAEHAKTDPANALVLKESVLRLSKVDDRWSYKTASGDVVGVVNSEHESGHLDLFVPDDGENAVISLARDAPPDSKHGCPEQLRWVVRDGVSKSSIGTVVLQHGYSGQFRWYIEDAAGRSRGLARREKPGMLSVIGCPVVAVIAVVAILLLGACGVIWVLINVGEFVGTGLAYFVALLLLVGILKGILNGIWGISKEARTQKLTRATVCLDGREVSTIDQEDTDLQLSIFHYVTSTTDRQLLLAIPILLATCASAYCDG